MTTRTASRTRATQTLRVPDGPRGHPIFGSAPKLQKNILDFLVNVHEEYGSPSRVRLFPGRYGYLLSDPDNYRQVLQEGSATYVKDVAHFEILSMLIGRSVVTLNGSAWKRRRKIQQPAFHGRKVAAFGETMTKLIAETLSNWESRPDGDIMDIEHEMTQLTLNIASETLLSSRFDGESVAVGDSFAAVNGFMSDRWVKPAALWTSRLPTPANRRYRESMSTLNAHVHGIIARRRVSDEDHNDVLSMLLEAVDGETGEGLTDDELRDEVLTVLVAGHETSSTALTWTLYLLSQAPEIVERLVEEVDREVGARRPTVNDLSNLSLVANVFNEALRLYPPAYVIGRKALLDDRIGGYDIPQGAELYLSPWVTHRRRDLWERPDAFEPDRFTEERMEGRPKHAFIPFGIGPRFCIGDAFARTESLLVIAMIVQRFRFALVENHPVTPKPLVTVRPIDGMPMKVWRRS